MNIQSKKSLRSRTAALFSPKILILALALGIVVKTDAPSGLSFDTNRKVAALDGKLSSSSAQKLLESILGQYCRGGLSRSQQELLINRCDKNNELLQSALRTFFQMIRSSTVLDSRRELDSLQNILREADAVSELRSESLIELMRLSGVFSDGAGKSQLVAKQFNFELAESEDYTAANTSEIGNWVIPIKLLSYPLQKIQYDIPNTLTSLVTESITRNPIDHLFSAAYETEQTVKLQKNGVRDFLKGLFTLNFSQALDGIFEITDGFLNIAQIGAEVAKGAISTVAYPAYRVAGGAPSGRMKRFKGRQGAIVLIDSAVIGDKISAVADTYGEYITRFHLKGLVEEYCAVKFEFKGVRPFDQLSDCVQKMKNVDTIHFMGLTHTGAMRNIQELAQEIKSINPKVEIGLMLSIGCYDPFDDKFASPDNTMGQVGLSWAVHHYLSNVMSKRLKGIPLRQAAVQAYYEGMFLPASVHPVSWASMAAIGSMNVQFGDVEQPETIGGYFRAFLSGYKGSRPRLRN